MRSILAKTPATGSKIAIVFSVFFVALQAKNLRIQGVFEEAR